MIQINKFNMTVKRYKGKTFFDLNVKGRDESGNKFGSCRAYVMNQIDENQVPKIISVLCQSAFVFHKGHVAFDCRKPRQTR